MPEPSRTDREREHTERDDALLKAVGDVLGAAFPHPSAWEMNHDEDGVKLWASLRDAFVAIDHGSTLNDDGWMVGHGFGLRCDLGNEHPWPCVGIERPSTERQERPK